MRLALKMLILESGYTARHIARDCNMSEQRLSNLVQGYGNPTPEERAKLFQRIGANDMDFAVRLSAPGQERQDAIIRRACALYPFPCMSANGNVVNSEVSLRHYLATAQTSAFDEFERQLVDLEAQQRRRDALDVRFAREDDLRAEQAQNQLAAERRRLGIR